MKTNWSEWRRFPDPNKKGYLNAPIGYGVYELRNIKNGELILFGMGKNCAYRMTSLLPKPLGSGTRNNLEKRMYVLENIIEIEYRCCACIDRHEAKSLEKYLMKNNSYVFQS